MTRPRRLLHRNLRALSRAAASALLLGLLAACAGQQMPDVDNTAAQQAAAAQYVAHARGNYVPPGPPEDPWGPYIHEAAHRFDIPEEWIRALMHVESGGQEYHDGQLVTSSVGAMGLMQVMPSTYQELRARYGLGDDPFDPHDNIVAGVAYMREMYDIYGSPAFLAAYNGGPNRLDDYLANQRPLPQETRHYVAMIAPAIAGIWPEHLSPAQNYAMNELPDNIPPGLRYGGHVMLASSHHATRHASRHEVMTARLVTRSHRGHESRPVEVAMVLPPEPPRAQKAAFRAHGTGFHFVEEAQAADVVSHGNGPGWGVQVGAYSSQAMAERAAGEAKAHLHGSGSRVVVESVREKHGKLWRARVVDMSRGAAEKTCHKLSHEHGGCMVISPASQS